MTKTNGFTFHQNSDSPGIPVESQPARYTWAGGKAERPDDRKDVIDVAEED